MKKQRTLKRLKRQAKRNNLNSTSSNDGVTL